MDKKVLVAYGSKHGATMEIAERIGDKLRRQGRAADVLEAGGVNELTPYGKIILGSSVYIGRWHKSAVRFLRHNGEALAQMPLWLFISGPTGEKDPMEQMEGWLYPKSLEKIIVPLNPRSIMCFGGKLTIEQLGPFERWIVKKVRFPEGDFRRWDDIDRWTDTVNAQ